MIGIFNCSSVESYIYEILEYSLDAEKISVEVQPKASMSTQANSSWLVTIAISNRASQIEIIDPIEADIQFGYKLVNSAIDSLKNQGVDNVTSNDFIRLRSVYNSLLNESALIYEPPLIGWFFPDESYRMAILYGLIREIELWEKVKLILPT
jgi:hypothetical protein